ncbi:MAG: MGMT family protein [Deltaproteobacteria bacterium]|nr:MGMT family protein [Candidatus Anaeroferrophillus wilburensis]MBN2888553.1 MGMT family protein [Deltaproteobacteria bacterium]
MIHLLTVPRGTVITYGTLATMAGYPGAARAVGRVMAANPFPLFYPCHRVIRADGQVGQYGGGTVLKQSLLAKEGITFDRRGTILADHQLKSP